MPNTPSTGISARLKLRNETCHDKEARHYRNADIYNYNAGTGRVDLSDFLNIVHDQKLIGNRGAPQPPPSVVLERINRVGPAP